MYEYLRGNVTQLTPTYAIVETNGIGYFINISINTYSKLSADKVFMLYLHQIVREDAHLLFGFFDNTEREVFRHLISVSGIGPNTARIILSSMTSAELVSAISTENHRLLQSIKGIGLKTAQRMVIELKDKIIKVEIDTKIFGSSYNTNREEALSALTMLGFVRNQVTKVVDNICKEQPNYTVEQIIKESLKLL